MTRKTLVIPLILTRCAILLIKPETAETQEPAPHIPDVNLRTAILKELGITQSPFDPVLAEYMRKLTELNAEALGISDLTGLQHATNLTKLNLNGNRISDVAPLSGLAQLIELELAVNDIVDVSPLAHLKNLSELDLGKNGISSVNLKR